jgi:hypothetical protein
MVPKNCCHSASWRFCMTMRSKYHAKQNRHHCLSVVCFEFSCQRVLTCSASDVATAALLVLAATAAIVSVGTIMQKAFPCAGASSGGDMVCFITAAGGHRRRLVFRAGVTSTLATTCGTGTFQAATVEGKIRARTLPRWQEGQSHVVKVSLNSFLKPTHAKWNHSWHFSH